MPGFGTLQARPWPFVETPTVPTDLPGLGLRATRSQGIAGGVKGFRRLPCSCLRKLPRQSCGMIATRLCG